MKKLLFFILLFFGIQGMSNLFAGIKPSVNPSVNIEKESEEPSCDQNIWVGPGTYCGVWFDNESDYHYWYRNRRLPNDHQDHYDHKHKGHGGQEGQGNQEGGGQGQDHAIQGGSNVQRGQGSSGGSGVQRGSDTHGGISGRH